jgi:hypothetical protein
MEHDTTPSRLPVNEIDAIQDILERVARGDPSDLESVLHTVEKDIVVQGTRISMHTHCIALDGNQRPRVGEFARQLAQYVTEYSIPRSRINAAYAHRERTGMSNLVNRLNNEARGLFTTLNKSGEGGELLLFVLGEILLKLPQLICKMDLKTSIAMHYHGADGLHVGAENGLLLLYWGEAKLHISPSDAIRECLSSIAPILSGPGGSGSPEERDIQLLQRGVDFEDPGLEAALKAFLDPKHANFKKTEFRGLCLVGFNADCYPAKPNSIALEEVVKAMKAEIPKWKNQIASRATIEAIETFVIHFFCVPFPSIDSFRTAFRMELGLPDRQSEVA